MKKLIFLTIFLSLSINAAAQNAAKPSDPPSTVYDAELAKKVGADEYGMRQYVFGILRASKTKRPEAKDQPAMQAGHMKNINKLADEGKLVLAGPFMDSGEMRGIFIFNVKTVEEAKKLVENDPLVSGGFLELELRPWFGSAALMEVTPIHKKIAKKSF